MDIDCAGFDELGIPSPLECWKHQAHMLASEVCELQNDLSRTRRQVHQLIRMHDQMLKERDALSLELTRVQWELSDTKLQQSQQATANLNAFASAHRGHGETAGTLAPLNAQPGAR
jgi:regulator of replication initiation timing